MSKRFLTESELADLASGGQWSPEDGERVVSAWRRSGLSMREFARRHGLIAQRLHWWRRRLEERPRVDKNRRDEVKVEEAKLVPVVLRAPAITAGAAMVVQVGGVALEVRDLEAVSPGWVAALLTALSGSAT